MTTHLWELIGHAEEFQAWRVAWLEGHQQIDIAVRTLSAFDA